MRTVQKKNLIGFWGLSISEQCKLLKISRSGYYSWKKRKSQEALHDSEADKEKKEREKKLVKDVMDAFMEHPSFGYRKMAEISGETTPWIPTNLTHPFSG